MTPSRAAYFLSLSLALLASGCGRKEPAPAAPPPVVAQPPVAESPAPADATPPPVVTSRASNDAAYIQEMTQTLNELLGDYIRTKKRIPKDINEMMNLQIITSIPVIPGNAKKWIIDPQTGKVSAK